MRAGCFAWFVFLVSRDCCEALPRGDMGFLRFVIVVFLDHTHLLFMKSMKLQICCLLLTFANSLDPDQAQHNFQSNLEQKMFDTQMVFLIIIFLFEQKIRRRQQ